MPWWSRRPRRDCLILFSIFPVVACISPVTQSHVGLPAPEPLRPSAAFLCILGRRAQNPHTRHPSYLIAVARAPVVPRSLLMADVPALQQNPLGFRMPAPYRG